MTAHSLALRARMETLEDRHFFCGARGDYQNSQPRSLAASQPRSLAAEPATLFAIAPGSLHLKSRMRYRTLLM